MVWTFVPLMVANLLTPLHPYSWSSEDCGKDQQTMGRLLPTCVTVNLVSYLLCATFALNKTGYPWSHRSSRLPTEGMLYCLTLDCQIKTAAQITTMTNTVSLLCSLLSLVG